MESHLPRTQEESDLSGNPAEPNSGVEGNSEGHQEKPSMLKRMKAKAKKIRNTLTGHGHDHDHDRDHSHSQSHDEEEEEEEMVEDLSSTIHAPDIRVHPSNVQIKTIDPAGRGSEEAEGITPVLKSFNKMGISEEKPKPEQGKGAGLYTRSHNQFDPEPVPLESSDYVSKGYNAAIPLDMSSSESSGSFPKSYNAANPGDTPEDVFDPESQSSTHTEKITSASSAASSALAGTAESAENAVASKIGLMREPGEGNKSGSVTGTAEGVSRKEYLVEKLNPGEEDKALSSMITEKPNGEKMEEVCDAEPEGKVTESEEKPKPEQGNGAGLYTRSHNQFDPEPVPSESSDYVSKGYNAANPLDMSSSESSGSFPKSYNAANPGDTPEDVFDPESQSSTHTEKITSASSAATSAIAGTAESAENAVASKIGLMREPGEGNKSESVTGTAKGVSRKEEYLVEKLKPGEEDKALSSMMTEKPNGEKMEEVCDAEPEGKVTESEEVAKRLGTGEEGSEVENVGSGGGVVSMLTGAIGSWFGGAQSTPGTNLADDNEGDMGKKNTDAQGVTAERRLQE